MQGRVTIGDIQRQQNPAVTIGDIQREPNVNIGQIQRQQPNEFAGTRYGVMAQDMAKTDIGKTAVMKDENGMLGIDIKKGMGVALASLADLNARLERVEGKKRE
jgi:hypothetical protein